MWLLLVAGLAGDPSDISDVISYAERYGDDLLLAERIAAGALAADARTEDVLRLGRAERAWLAGDVEQARTELRPIEPRSPLYARAQLLEAQAHRDAGRMKSAVRAYVQIARDKRDALLVDVALLNITELYQGHGLADQAPRYALMVRQDSPYFGDAATARLGLLTADPSLMAARVAIARGERLQRADLQESWFEPSFHVWMAYERLPFCAYDEAERALDLARDEGAARTSRVTTALASTDEALWPVLRDGGWADPQLAAWIERDPQLRRPLALARTLEATGERPAAARTYRDEALGWVRLRLAAASARIEAAGVAERAIRDQLAHDRASPPPATVCWLRPPGPLGRVRPFRNLDPSWVALQAHGAPNYGWPEIFGRDWYETPTQCRVPTEPVHCID